ncbi:hypothetical protein EON77_01405, partial [bacterium]
MISAAETTRSELAAYIAREVARYGTTEAARPAHRVKFFWPPHPVSYSYHVLTSDWTGTATFEAHGETFLVKVARTPYGVFGRCDAIWHEERGETEAEMLWRLRESAEPLFRRQIAIAETLERESRFTGEIGSLAAIDWLKLLYTPDRDVANEAHWLIERARERHELLPALLFILQDRTHPHRRSAQWCVLDLFEDLPSFAATPEATERAVASIGGLLADAEDDYARTVYKAGVVLGGHLPHHGGAEALLANLTSPSRIGRRSAIHALFHVVEWLPERRAEIVTALRSHARGESDTLLSRFASNIA